MRRAPEQHRALDDVEPDPAAADHGDGGPGRRPGHPDDGAHTGRHAAADQGGPIQGDALVDLAHHALVHQHLLREGGQPGELHDRAAVGQAQPPLAQHASPVTQVRPSRQAELALAAKAGEKDDGVIARLHVGDALADRLHHARPLVAEQGRALEREGPLHVVQIAVAQTGGGGADQHLARRGLVDPHLLHRQLTRALVQHRTQHAHPQVHRRRGDRSLSTSCGPSVSAARER